MKCLSMLVLMMMVFMGSKDSILGQQWNGPDNVNSNINRSGSVGIGTSALISSAKLTVNGSIGFPNAVTPMMYVYESGSSNPERPIIVHSPFYQDWGLFYKNDVDHMIFKGGGSAAMTINLAYGGQVGIGTTNWGNYKLSVNGTIRSKEIVVETNWSDFVFAEDYALMPLNNVERYIKENKHLPDIPSEKEVLKNGVSLGEMQSKLLQKIEELTLYMIDLKKENEQLKQRMATLEKK